MIEKIIIHIGGLRQKSMVEHFFLENASQLVEFGILYPRPLSIPNRPILDHGRVIISAQTKEQINSQMLILDEIENCIQQISTPITTLIISHCSLYNDLEALHKTVAMLQSRFSFATPEIIFTFSRPDRELEACYCCNSFFSAYDERLPLAWITSQKHRIFAFDQYLRILQSKYHAKNVHLIVDNGIPKSIKKIQGELLQAVGIPCAAINEKHFTFPCDAYQFNAPIDFYYLCRVCQSLTAPERLPWYEQEIFFLSQNSDKHQTSLITHESRKKILVQFARFNPIGASLFEHSFITELSNCSSEDTEYSGITDDSVVMIAKHLQPDFLQILLDKLHSISEYSITSAGKCCINALRRLCKQPNCIPDISVSPPRASVAVLTATYNHAEFIAQNIESIINQKTNFAVQHIIADDCSNDGTQEIIYQYAAKYPHIMPLFRRVRNSISNIHTLFDTARTPYVAICDGDDYFADPLKLQIQYDFLEGNQACALCFHPVNVVYEGSLLKDSIYPLKSFLPRESRVLYYLSDLINKNFMQTSSVMYRWRFVDGLPPWFRSDLVPGDWYWHLIHAERGKIGFIDRIMSVYRRHTNAMYYLSTIDRIAFRYKFGCRELETYAAVDEHFKGQHKVALATLAAGVFADLSLYAKQHNDEKMVNKAVLQYPEFAAYFLEVIGAYSLDNHHK